MELLVRGHCIARRTVKECAMSEGFAKENLREPGRGKEVVFEVNPGLSLQE